MSDRGNVLYELKVSLGKSLIPDGQLMWKHLVELHEKASTQWKMAHTGPMAER